MGANQPEPATIPGRPQAASAKAPFALYGPSLPQTSDPNSLAYDLTFGVVTPLINHYEDCISDASWRSVLVDLRKIIL